MSEIVFGESSPRAKALQGALLSLGYEMPRYGQDGIFGNETVDALEDFIDDHPGHKLAQGRGCGAELEAAVHAVYKATHELKLKDVQRDIESDDDFQLIDLTMEHPRLAKKGVRPWKEITGITLHQTACWMGNKPERYKKLRAHVAVLQSPEPTAVLVYPPTDIVYHGNAFNRTDVGFEFDGLFAGVEGDKRTAWDGGGKYRVGSPSENQIAAGRFAVERIMEMVAAHGGEIKYIHAHRQSNETRLSDPGSAVWQAVGVWAQKRFGLSDGGEGYKLRDGNPIPREWDASRLAPYRPG